MDIKEMEEEKPIPYWVSILDGSGKRKILSIRALSAAEAVSKALAQTDGGSEAYTV
jgi:hypothetical protein